MKKSVFAFSVLLFSLVSIFAKGEIIEKDVFVSRIENIEACSFFDVNIIKSNKSYCRLEVSEEFEEYLDVRFEDGTLYIGLVSNADHMMNRLVKKIKDYTLKVYVGIPSLCHMSFSGAVSVVFEGDNINGNNLNMVFSGAVKACGLDASVDRINIEVSGASKLEDFAVKTESGRLAVTGASRVAGNVKSDYLSIDMGGASSSSMSVYADELDIILSGASNLDILACKNQTLRQIKFSLSGASTLDAAEADAEHIEAKLSGASRAMVAPLKSISVSASSGSRLSYKKSEGLVFDKLSISGGASLRVL